MTAVDRRWGSRPGAVLFLCLFAAQSALLVLSPILTRVAAEFEVSTSVAAQLRAVSGVTAGAVALFMAVRGDRYSLTTLLYLGLALLAAGSVASALAPLFSLLLLAQVVIGFGLALVLSGGLAASEVWASGVESSRVLSWALVGQPVAWIVGQPVVGAVADIDWRWAWVAVPLASSLLAIAGLARRDMTTPNGALVCDPAGLWRHPAVKRWAIGELTAFSAWAGTLVYAGAFFIESYQAGVFATGLILGVVAAAYLPGNFLGRRLLARGPTGVLVGSALALTAGITVFGMLRLGVAFSTVVLAGLAFFAGGRTIAGAALGLQLAEGQRLAAMSLRTALLQFGYLAGTGLGGVVLPVWGYTGMGWTYAVLFLIAGVVHLDRSSRGRARRQITVGGHLRRG